MASPDFHQLYAATLDLQAQFCATETREVLASLPAFQRATHILEIGCGAGAQVGALGGLLDGKCYLGIDLSADMIDIATQRFSNKKSVIFQKHDLLTYTPHEPFDFVLSFAVLQHVNDVSLALQQCSRFLKPGGVIAICDANGADEFESHPDLPELRRLYRSLSEDNTGGARKTSCLQVVKNIAPQLGLHIRADQLSSHIARTRPERDLFVQLVNHVAQVAAMKYDSHVNDASFQAELKEWVNRSDSWVKLTGGSWLVVEKRVM